MGAPGEGAPSIILMPELSVGTDDITNLRDLVRAARANTLLICGVGHMTADQVDQIEPSAHLLGVPVPGHYANCAVIGCGGMEEIFLQPKVVPSREELDCHWPGRVVRYFVGEYFQFVVFICSEMLDRAQAMTTIGNVLDELEKHGRHLAAVFWLQHNKRPRSDSFSQSLERITRLDRPTLFIVGSRNRYPPRFENYAVSGALFKKATLSKHFNILTRKFHYVEPVRESIALSRVVLLRYDVDVNLVETVLANAIEDGDRTPRSQVFSSVVPMVMQGDELIANGANTHLDEIAKLARDIAVASDNTQADRIQILTDALIALETPGFQNFLDRAIVPRPREEKYRHAAGQEHSGGDSYCDCWKHRECIDSISDDNIQAEPIVHVLLALARIASQGLSVSFNPDSSANIRLTGSTRHYDLCIVYPFHFDADATEIAVLGGIRPKTAELGYIILGTSGRAGRPALAHISQAVAKSISPVQAASATTPLLKAIYNDELMASGATGQIAELVHQRFG